MATSRLDIFWSPVKSNDYIVFGSDVSLFRIENADENTAINQGARVSVNSFAKQLSQSTEGQFPKCMAWYPHDEKDYLVAVGQANGNILLSSLDQKKNDDLIGRQFVPKHPRTCNDLAWHVSPESSLLAAALDKCRSDPSVLIWDVSRHGDRSLDAHNPLPLGKLINFYGNSEPAVSLAWFPGGDRLVVGVNKYIRVWDLRDSTKQQCATSQPTKALCGVCIDPIDSNQVASYSEQSVSVWDIRKLKTAKYELPIPKASQPVKISWCPNRSGLLACLIKDSPVIRVFDIQHIPFDLPDSESSFNERIVKSSAESQPLASFDWHPKDENRIITITNSGSTQDFKLFERINLDFASCGSAQQLCWSDVKKFRTVDVDMNVDADISVLMRRRALDNYGLLGSEATMDCIQEDSSLLYVWGWVKHMSQLFTHESDLFPSSVNEGPAIDTHYVGVSHMLQGTSSSVDKLIWHGTDVNQVAPLSVYTSVERNRCLTVLGWPLSRVGLPEFVNTLERDHMYCRATAIALFYGDITTALGILTRGAAHTSNNQETGNTANLSIVAMALAGINNMRNALWVTSCRDMLGQINEPYLRAAFTFLTCEDNYESILNEQELEINDRLAFACLYLSDAKLKEFEASQRKTVLENGDIHGLVLTGLGVDGVSLLQEYVDRSGDIQTATLIMIHSFPSPQSKNKRVLNWIENYSNLLDKWKLWVLRARFDIFRKEKVSSPTERPLDNSQIFLSCAFCSKPIVPSQVQQRRLYMQSAGNQNAKMKVTVCHECRKPLPRCSLCLKHMGTASGFLGGAPEEKPTSNGGDHAVADFDNWFTWCQSCRHGGHTIHMESWFNDNTECPVNACACKCGTLDSAPPVKPLIAT